ncbi:MAG: patatin-like phospholipase family protein [Burkholderiales bacterium]|nr:patatin-like phospholipase family protein [Burkholderiales bacterium]
MQDVHRPVRFERVLNEEIDLIGRARTAFGVATEPIEPADADTVATTRARAANLCGLALSGGGIRSATFCLGILQAFSRHRLLGRFDYLSTVSGGGYIGAWLSAWIRRHPRGVHGVQQEMRDAVLGNAPEPREIGWLRDYSNYLMLRLGYLSGDGWATIAIYLRNLWLNLTLIVACLGIAMLLPRLLIHGLDWVPGHWFSPLGVALIAISIACIIMNLVAADDKWLWFRSQPGVLFAIVAPGVLASLMLAHALIVDFPWAAPVRTIAARIWPGRAPLHQVSWIVAGALIYTLPWLGGAVASLFLRSPAGSARFRWETVVAFAPFAGALIGWMCYGYQSLALAVVTANWDASSWLVTAFGTPLLLVIISFALVLHIGLVSRGFSEDIREWWGRLGGWSTLVMIAWALGFAVVIYAPALVTWAGEWMAALGIGWLTITIIGVLLGRTASTGVVRSGRILEWITAVLPFVFVAGLFVAVAVGMHVALAPDARLCVAPPDDPDATIPDFSGHAAVAYCELALTKIHELALWLFGLLALAYLLELRVDVNVFSLGPLYRNRLLRCYLGASRQGSRRPHLFTGFDRDDDIALADLGGPATSLGPSRPQRPYPLINTAINLTTGQKLAWQQRKAGSFLFSPLYCGYQMPEEGTTRWIGRYCATLDYVSAPLRPARRGSIALSNAVTISGAAASPNAGYHSSPAVAFLLTVFSVRLGSWFQNPRRPDVWRKPGPAHSLVPLLSELFGMSNDHRRFVYLSDGGHFENLGIYELVRRRCRFIICCDASCDPNSTFEDLGNAIRKCRIDLGVDIEIDVSAIRPRGDTGLSKHHCALGLLRYDRIHPHAGVGYLLYIKASMCGTEPQDVVQYRSEHPEFPHQTTADQFFDEPQFESYRRLGLHVGDIVLRGACARARADDPRGGGSRGDESGADIDLERLFKELRQRWYPSLPLAEGVFTRHADALDRVFERIRGDERLRFLDRQLHPEWTHLEHGVGAQSRDQPWLPDDVQALRAAFYLCESIIQLMENVYIDVNLETTYDHPDNRGWMNLFRRFSGAGMLRITWAISAATYGARFQSFCEHHLGLGDSTIEQGGVATVADVLAGRGTLAPHSLEHNVIDALRGSGELADSDRVVRFYMMMGSSMSAALGRSSFGFPVAFAVMRAPDADAAHWRLRYLRVSDHLQRMGLGWRVTLVLLQAYPDLELDLATRAPELRVAGSEGDRTRFVRLFRAAKRIGRDSALAPVQPKPAR